MLMPLWYVSFSFCFGGRNVFFVVVTKTMNLHALSNFTSIITMFTSFDLLL